MSNAMYLFMVILSYWYFDIEIFETH